MCLRYFVEAHTDSLPAPEDNARVVLDIYKHFGTPPGEVLLESNFFEIGAARNLRADDISSGLEYAYEQGWVDGQGYGAIMLTEAGFAEIK